MQLRYISEIVKLNDLPGDEVVSGAHIPTMITPSERRALSLFASKIYEYGCPKDSIIIDAGSFLGSSTTALADGLGKSRLSEEEQTGRIHSFDLFIATAGMITGGYFTGRNVQAGGSFREVFDEMISNVSQKVRVFQGDILHNLKDNEAPISILFLDILWSNAVTLGVSKAFYPRLQPGKSILIHQDFVYPFYPWVIIHMGLMEEYFKVAYNIPWSSMAFDIIKDVPPFAIPDSRDIDFITCKKQYEKFVRIVEGWGRGALWLGFALYAASVSKFDEAFEAICSVENAYSKDPLVSQYFPAIRGYCERAALSGTPAPIHVGV